MNLTSLARRHQREFERTLARHGTTIPYRWRTMSGTAGHPSLECTQEEEAWTDHTDTIKAMVHYVEMGKGAFQRALGVRDGDVILDVSKDVDFSGKTDPVFTLDGIDYVQAEIGTDLQRAWDARVGDVRISQTLLLRPQSQ